MKTQTCVVITLITWIIYNNISYANPNSNTYLGLDACYSSTTINKKFGGNIFSNKITPGLIFSLGDMYNKYIGGEIGFEADKSIKKNTNLSGNEPLFGDHSNDSDLIYSTYHSTLRQKNIYFGITYKTNIHNNNNNFISILLGVAYSTFKLKATLLGEQIFNPISDSQEFYSEYKTYSFNKSKLTPLIQLSFKHIHNNVYGLKLFCTWKKLSPFNLKEKYNNIDIIKLKNFLSAGFGVSYYLS